MNLVLRPVVLACVVASLSGCTAAEIGALAAAAAPSAAPVAAAPAAAPAAVTPAAAPAAKPPAAPVSTAGEVAPPADDLPADGGSEGFVGGNTPDAPAPEPPYTGPIAADGDANPGEDPGPGFVDPASAAACAAEKSNADKDNGTGALGAYNNQYLPKGWNAVHKSEAAVSSAIDKIKGDDWACFQKFYPGATTVWKKKRGL